MKESDCLRTRQQRRRICWEEQRGTMSDTKELTYAEVSEHTSKKDLFIVVHDEVFNASSFVDEHP